MADLQGWVKIHRKILLNPVVCKDSDHFAVWMYLILEATHKDTPKIFNGEKITLHPGQLIRCLETISTKLHVSKSKVNRILKVLKSEKQIETLSKRHGTLFTLLNWSEYQATETQNETPVENQRKTNETPVERNKNVKNVKNGKKKDIGAFTPPSLQEVKDYVNERQLVIEPEFFFNYFTDNNWVDRNGNEVKSWKQKMLTWDKNEREKNPKPKEPQTIEELMKGIVKNGG